LANAVVCGSAADHLVQCTLIDGHPDLVFEPGDILAEQVFRDAAIERINRAFHLVRGHVDRRHHDIRDAEYDFFAGLPGLGHAKAVFRRAEDGIEGRRRKGA
jgi:hypothetical protein